MITTLIASAFLGTISSDPPAENQTQGALGLIMNPVNEQGEFTLKFVNESDAPTHLNLGVSLGGGQRLLLQAVKLIAEQDGKNLEWLYAPGGMGRRVGRYDDYIVSLAPKASYELVLNLRDYSTKGPGGRHPAPGKYRVTAHFVGTGLVQDNPDLAGNKLLKFWEGGAYSRPVEFEYQPK